MEIIKGYKGLQETKYYYGFKVNTYGFAPLGYQKYLQYRNMINDPYVSMKKEKYFKILTKNINDFHKTNDQVFFKTYEDANKAINNLLWYLLYTYYE